MVLFYAYTEHTHYCFMRGIIGIHNFKVLTKQEGIHCKFFNFVFSYV